MPLFALCGNWVHVSCSGIMVSMGNVICINCGVCSRN